MKTILLALSMLFLSSCATILGGSRVKVHLHNLPANAVVYYNGVNKGNASTIKVQRQTPGKVKIVADSCQHEIYFSKKPAIGFIVLDVVTGVVPLVIDAVAGNLSKPTPRHIDFECQEIKK